jgi:hypothetical protein
MSYFNVHFFGFTFTNARMKLIIIVGIAMQTTGEYVLTINHDGIPFTVNTPLGMNVKNENAMNSDISETTLCSI